MPTSVVKSYANIAFFFIVALHEKIVCLRFFDFIEKTVLMIN